MSRREALRPPAKRPFRELSQRRSPQGLESSSPSKPGRSQESSHRAVWKGSGGHAGSAESGLAASRALELRRREPRRRAHSPESAAPTRGSHTKRCSVCDSEVLSPQFLCSSGLLTALSDRRRLGSDSNPRR